MIVERTVQRTWNGPQSKFLRATERFLDLEGAIRSGKTTAGVWKLINYAAEFPGIQLMLSRWTDDSLKAQLKPKFYEECPKELLGRWHADEQCQDFKPVDGKISRLYIRALKSSDEKSKYGKFAGLTLAVILVDQAEEVPEDVMLALTGRLSQPGYPQQLLLTPNPPGIDHWLSHPEKGWFPEGRPMKPDYLYLCTSVYDNAHILGETFIRALEATYPQGHPMRRRYIEGRRGLSLAGDPVYKNVFKREFHVTEAIEPLRTMPLLESWDFGHAHPAVAWGQFRPDGSLQIYAELMGDNEYIDSFIPRVKFTRQQYFKEFTEIWTCCDPSGADAGTHGMRQNAVDILRDNEIFPRWVDGSNSPPQRDFAIQAAARLMLRLTKGGPAFLVHPRCQILTDGFEAGYVYAERARQHSLYPNIRVPLKDGYYDHLQNTLEYMILNFALPLDITDNPLEALERPLMGGPLPHVGRAGY